MTQLLDLDDNSLLEVLDRLPADQLYKMLSVNSRLRLLAGDKMRVKVKAVVVDSNCLESYLMRFKDCVHLGSVRQNEILVLNKLTSRWRSETALLSVLPKLAGVKAIDFGKYNDTTGEMLKSTAINCPDVECLKIGWLSFGKEEWSWAFDRIGKKIVHFTKHYFEEERKRMNQTDENDLLKMIVEKCVNIKRLDWWVFDVIVPLSLVKKLPKCCWVDLNCYRFAEDVYEDVVDSLSIDELNWPKFGRRFDRLSLLVFNELKHDDDSIIGVNFAGLKMLDFDKENYQYNRQSVDCLIASRFSRLEQFCFRVTGGLTEEDFDALFQRMMSIKKLSIYCDSGTDMNPRLPVAAILKLKDLETIVFGFCGEQNDWHFQMLFQQLEQYNYGIRSLKKFTVDMRRYTTGRLRETVINKFKHLKAEQTRVQVELLL